MNNWTNNRPPWQSKGVGMCPPSHVHVKPGEAKANFCTCVCVCGGGGGGRGRRKGEHPN